LRVEHLQNKYKDIKTHRRGHGVTQNRFQIVDY
jgi:hypothetical protein